MIRPHVILAISSRNLAQYFSGVLGYLFIGVFVTMCALATFSQQFFAENLATLDQLSSWFPWLLLFLTPAISMSVWADERRQGTDALLFTLPASDMEILLGKFFAVAGVYTVALVFSLTNLVALQNLGQPDWGILATTYLGYWLAGLALLAIGMFASSLTDSPTVAFVLGAVFSSMPVVIGQYFSGNPLVESFGFAWNLHDFTIGLISAQSLLYFVALIAIFLYLNLIVISKRQWRTNNSVAMWGRYLTRLAALGVTLVSLIYVVSTASTSQLARVDMTREKAFSLDQTTIETIEKLKTDEKAVTIQAFVSNEVPRDFANIKKQFLGMLRQLSFYGGKNIEVNLVSVAPNSVEAEQAEKTGIVAQDVTSEVGGKMIQQKVYLGAYLSSSIDDATIPKLDSQTSVEYELTRALATTTQKNWKIKIGVLDTDTHFGGIMFRGERTLWVPYTKTMKQLQSSFEIMHIDQPDLAAYVDPPSPPEGTPPPETKPEKKKAPDVLLVADPASLDDSAADALVKYIEEGNPVLILTDPLPWFWTTREPKELGILNAPRQPRVSPQSPYAQQLTSSPMPKADNGTAARVSKALGINWDNGAAAWHMNNPHPNFTGFWPPYLGPTWPEYYGRFEHAFVYVNQDGAGKTQETSADTTNKTVSMSRTFNENEIVSKHLREVLFFYPGHLAKASDAEDLEFIPLIQLNDQSGSIPWGELTFSPSQRTQSMNPTTRRMEVKNEPVMNQITDDKLYVIKPNSLSTIDAEPQILAARVVGRDPAKKKANAIVIADLDFVSESYYEQQDALKTPSLDNYRLLQNAIEVLADKSGFVALRNRRSSPRTLTTFEKMISVYRQQRVLAESENKKQIDAQLKTAQERLDKSLQSIDEDQSTSFIEKLQLSSQEAVDSQEKFDREQQKLEKELASKNQILKAQEARQVTSLENWIRFLAVGLAPLPALLLAIVVLTSRAMNERKEIRPERTVR
ncbi:MAG: Gldg family protein [Pirellulaceae bacterium]